MGKEKKTVVQSDYLNKAAYRIENKKWLGYSSNISRRILAALEDRKDLDRNLLAEKLEVTTQYISKLVQGQENLSLKTISKISEALGVELLTFPEYKYSKKSDAPQTFVAEITYFNNSLEEIRNIPYLSAIKGNLQTYSTDPKKLELDLAS